MERFVRRVPFGAREAVARARCIVTKAEIALASRDLGWPAKMLGAARATLEEHGDRFNAAYARYLEIRRLLLIGRLDDAERMLADLDPTPFPPASRTAHELVVAGIAMRRLRTKAARAALARAEEAAREARIPALTAEVEGASHILNTPAARRIVNGEAPVRFNTYPSPERNLVFLSMNTFGGVSTSILPGRIESLE
jgi:hypothetical protein